ncbi:MAG: hypothetical protein J5836_01880 [Clostridia bacterium]|nr:hypothetical protein [Clostridia bacterium]
MLEEKKIYEMPSLMVFKIEEDVLLYSGEGDSGDEYVKQFDPTWIP